MKKYLTIFLLVITIAGCSDPKRDEFIGGLKYRITGKANPSFRAVGKAIVEMTADNVTPEDCESLSKGMPLSAGLKLGFTSFSCKNRISGESWTYPIVEEE